MLIAALIFVISMAMTAKFAILSWHAGVLRVASQSIEEGTVSIAGAHLAPLEIKDFPAAEAYQQLCPDLGNGLTISLRPVRNYYSFLRILNSMRSMVLPTAKSGASIGWAGREMALCTRYACVALSQRVQLNRAMAAHVRGF